MASPLSHYYYYSCSSYHSLVFHYTKKKRLFSTATASANINNWKISAQQRINIVFGANTDVGKTVISAGLVQASLQQRPVHYIKPLQCGGSDERFVQKHQVPTTDSTYSFTTQTLFTWDTPTSPHTACVAENKPVSDIQLLQTVTEAIQHEQQQHEHVTTYIETAGGVLSPAAASPENRSISHATTTSEQQQQQWGWIPQADLYQPLMGVAPVVLVGDGRLGGISATLAALEVLVARGYDVAAVVLLENLQHDNASAIRALTQRVVPFRSGTGERLFAMPSQSIVSLPPVPADPDIPLTEWYESTRQPFAQLEAYLQQYHEGQVHDWRSMARDASRVLWYPAVQHKQLGKQHQHQQQVMNNATNHYHHHIVERSDGAMECVSFANAVGHADSTQNLATAAALGRYGRIDGNTTVTSPSLTLALLLNADKVLFTQNPVEAALYMAFRTYFHRKDVSDPQNYEWAVVGQEGCYHGDAVGAIHVAEPRQTYVEDQHPWYASKSLLLETPTWGYTDGVLTLSLPESYQIDTEFVFETVSAIMDISARLISHRKLHSQYKEMIEMQWLVYEHAGVNRKIAGTLLEPIMTGLDCKFVDPLWQRALVDVSQSRGVPVILDEKMSGMYRFGVQNAEQLLQVKADIVCYDGNLDGALSATTTTNEVFDALFLNDEPDEAFLGGHYLNTAQPDSCARAIHVLEACRTLIKAEPGSFIMFDEEQVADISRLPVVKNVATFGSVLQVALVEPYDDEYKRTNRAAALLCRDGINVIRNNNVICAMVSPAMADSEYCTEIGRKMASVLMSLK